MDFGADDKLSYMIRVSGEVVPAMPDDGEFPLQEIRDYVAGTPEVACETADGFLLFRNKHGAASGLAHNGFATFLYRKASRQKGSVFGRVFLAHPAHVAPYWKAGKRPQ